MADIQKIKIGTDNPDAILFDNYKTDVANEGIIFGSIIPKDNSNTATTTVSQSVWQINDGWEVEIISPKKIAIKKFKIDTWGLRQIIGNPHTNPNYNNLKVNVTGITRVHNEVICHTSGSNTPDGFTKAYGGNGGYNIYWYPGQFTSGNSMQGLVIQFGCGYGDNNNERDDGLQIGKHPWDIGTKVGITDGVITGTWGDGSYRAITIGLYGGVQNAESWHDETGEAYKQYDISDNPIYIDLDVADTTKEIDVTSKECWDVYAGEEQIYHKDKTLENCWKKYGLAFPFNWRLVRPNFSTNSFIEWISPTAFKIKGVPSEGITIDIKTTTTANYVQINWKQFVVNLNKELPDGVTVKVVRAFTNAYYNYDEDTHTWSNPVEDIETVLSVGDNTIAAFSDEIHKKDTDESMSYSECKIVITSNTSISDISNIIEIYPTFTEDGLINITKHWNINNLNFPAITDLEEHIDKLLFQTNPANADFWTPIKEYYATHEFAGDAVYQKFIDAKKLDEISLILPGNNFLSYDNTFKRSSISKLTLNGQYSTFISSLNGIFEGMVNLKELVVNIEEHMPALAAPSDTSNAFNGCALSTYPANFIHWSRNRANAPTFSKPAIIAHATFYWSEIETIPSYGSNPDAEANTIRCGYSLNMFFNCQALTTVGPILDLQLIKPTESESIFINCTKLSSIRIKNLNHGDWHFDDTEFASGKRHGTLEALDESSVQYLFEHLTDLNLYDEKANKVNINTNFYNWGSDYFDSGKYESAYNFKIVESTYFVANLRSENRTDAPFILHTNSNEVSMIINVSSLAEGDSLIFGADGDVEPDFTITSNGQYTITKNDNLDKGFKLIGNTAIKTDIGVRINRGWDLSIPSVQSANLYCPAEWTDKVTSEMITSANAKNWTIYIGGVEVQPE